MARTYGWLWEQGADDKIDGNEYRTWSALAAEKFAVENRQKWFRDYEYTTYPLKAQLQEDGLDLILAGWKPAAPFIIPQTRVVAFGSCFAAHFIEWLARNGYNQEFIASSRALLRNPFENAAVIAQQFRWAFGEIDPASLLWVDKDKQQIVATEERRVALRQALLDADVFVTTLSMSETWYDKTSGEPLWRVLPTNLHDPERHAYKVLSFAETIAALETIDRIRAQWLPKLRIIYTVSPLPMSSTFRPISAVTANMASKAIVRGALDEFLRGRPEDINRVYYYFPGYELVTALFNDAYTSDGRHLHQHVIDAVQKVFASVYTTSGPGLVVEGTAEWKKAVGTNALVAELERLCDERTAENRELNRALNEQQRELRALHFLHETCRRQYAHVQRLKRRLILPRLKLWWRGARRRMKHTGQGALELLRSLRA
jgi:hypothetical protein